MLLSALSLSFPFCSAVLTHTKPVRTRALLGLSSAHSGRCSARCKVGAHVVCEKKTTLYVKVDKIRKLPEIEKEC